MLYKSVLSVHTISKIALLILVPVPIYFLNSLLNTKKYKVSCLRNVCAKYHESNS